MKKIFFTFFMLLTGLMLNAQIPMKLVSPSSHFFKASSNPYKKSSTRSNTSQEVLLDYIDADEAQYGQNSYDLFTFPMNSRYTEAQGNADSISVLMNYGVVGFDTLFDNYSQTAFSRKNVDSISIDTVEFGLSHENLSGTTDTLIIELVPLTVGGYPILTGTPYATDTIYTDTSLSRSLDTLAFYGWTPGINIKAQQFGIAEYYYGSYSDIFYLWSGAPYFGSSGCSFSDGTALAYKSIYYPNSYAYWAGSQQELPTSTGGDIFYPCLSKDTTYTPGVDGASYIEDILFIASVRLNPIPEGIQRLNSTFALTSVSPNPAGKIANLNLQLKTNSNLTIELVDLSGRVIKSIYEGSQITGTHQYQLDLADVTSGAYLVNVIADDGSKDFAKLVVIK